MFIDPKIHDDWVASYKVNQYPDFIPYPDSPFSSQLRKEMSDIWTEKYSKPKRSGSWFWVMVAVSAICAIAINIIDVMNK